MRFDYVLISQLKQGGGGRKEIQKNVWKFQSKHMPIHCYD